MVQTDDVRGDRKRLRETGATVHAQGRRVVAIEDPRGTRWELVQAAA